MGKITIEKRYAQTEKFPHNCMICVDNNAEKSVNTNYYFYPYWTYFALLLGLIPFIVLAVILKKEQRVNVQICEECHSKWKMLPTFGCLLGFVEFIILIAMIVFFVDKQNALGYASLALLILLPAVYVIAHNNKFAVTCTDINDYYITLNIPNDRYPAIYQDYMMSNQGEPEPEPEPEFTPNSPYSPNSGYSANSGASVQCPHCGNVNMAGARFCERCGQNTTPQGPYYS
ncbi:MAG: zinc ribbon domain-containing protein [Firmicutes bacterium]|nr:zinc ribbon domain-containing protein [Bacillota bacterium]